MTLEEAIKGMKSLVEVRRKYGDMQTMKDEIECLEMAIKALTAISELSKSLKAVNRYEMDEKVLIGFNMAVAIFNRCFGENGALKNEQTEQNVGMCQQNVGEMSEKTNGMTLQEAIKHAEEVMVENLEKTKGRNASDPIAIKCGECAEEHRQLAEWLKELKQYKEQTDRDLISRETVKYYIQSHINEIITESGVDKNEHTNSILRALVNGIETMPSAEKTTINPQKTTITDGDLISRKAVLAIIDEHDYCGKLNGRTDFYKQLVEDLPIAEKTAEWIFKDGIYGVAYCSKCDYELHTNDTKYCPNCGRRMKGVGNE